MQLCKKLVLTTYNELMIESCFMFLGGNKHWILVKHIMMDIYELQDQTFTSRSNIYVCDNNGRDLCLLGVIGLVVNDVSPDVYIILLVILKIGLMII